MPDERGQPSRSALIEVVVIVAICLVCITLAVLYTPIKRVVDSSERSFISLGDGLVTAAIVVPVGLAVFVRRRMRDLEYARQELVSYAVIDPLTGLPNRRALFEWICEDIEHSQSRNSQAAVLFIDLDRFKNVNDTHGHDVGDRLMAAVARRLEEVVADTGRVLRYGGDEFVICAPALTPVSARRLAENLIRMVERPFTVGNESLRISACVGIALSESHGEDPRAILHDADLAMLQAKVKGTGEIVMFDRSMSAALTPAKAERRIRTALDDGQFRLHYQPVVDLGSGRIVGAEALLRWIDDEGTMRSPAEFIPVLEETGLIVPVGTWVLQEACREIAVITQLLPDADPMTITVNVSPRQIAQVDFADTVSLAIEAAGIDASQVHLEITEVALLNDVGSAWAALRRVKTQGVKLALDDFGTGYSSLSYVRRFSLDMLKIDKTFVDGVTSAEEDQAIIEHVIGMAHALRMVTVAEGIEEIEQIAILRRLGCKLGQGYAFSRPIPASTFEEMLVKKSLIPFAIDPSTTRQIHPVTDPSAHDETTESAPSIVDLSPPMARRVPRALRPAPATTSAVPGLVVPDGKLLADDDRHATVRPVVGALGATRPVRPQAAAPAPAPDGENLDVSETHEPGPTTDIRLVLPRLRELRPVDQDS